MNVRPFLVLGATQRERLLQSLQADVDEWLAHWVGEARALNSATSLEEVVTTKPSDGLKFVGAGADSETDLWAVFAIDTEGLSRLALQLLDEHAASGPCAGPIAQEFALQALRDLGQAWMGASELSSKQGKIDQLIPAAARRPGHGVLDFSLQLGGGSIYCCLPFHALLSRLDAAGSAPHDAAAAPVTVAQAVGNQRVRLRATLGPVELSVETIAQLRPGDVVRLEKPITEPLTLQMSDSEVGFRGYLGKQQERVAFRVVENLDENI